MNKNKFTMSKTLIEPSFVFTIRNLITKSDYQSSDQGFKMLKRKKIKEKVSLEK